MNILFNILLFVSLTTCAHYNKDKKINKKIRGAEAEYAQQHVERISSSVEKPWNLQNSLQYFKAGKIASMLYQLDISYSFQSNLALELFLPIYLKNKYESFVSRGIGDLIINTQWVPWQGKAQSFVVTGGLKFPSGDTHKVPVTGTGNYAFNLSFASYHASDSWNVTYYLNTLLNLVHKGYKVGNAYNYELLLSKQTALDENTYLSIGGELFGTFLQSDRSLGRTVLNSGGHTLYLGPIATFKYKDLQLQVLFQGVISQRLFGVQYNNEYTALVACTYNF